MHKGYRVIGVDLVPERLERVRARGAEVLDLREHESDLAEMIRGMTDGRGTDSVIDAVGMEAHGSPGAKVAHQLVGLLPDAVAEKLMETAPGSTGCTPSTSRSTSSAAAARSRWSASTAGWPTRCRC